MKVSEASVRCELSHKDVEQAVKEFIERKLEMSIEDDSIDISFTSQTTKVENNEFTRIHSVAIVYQ